MPRPIRPWPGPTLTSRTPTERPIVYKCRHKARPWVPLLYLVGLALGLAAAFYFLGGVRISLF